MMYLFPNTFHIKPVRLTYNNSPEGSAKEEPKPIVQRIENEKKDLLAKIDSLPPETIDAEEKKVMKDALDRATKNTTDALNKIMGVDFENSAQLDTILQAYNKILDDQNVAIKKLEEDAVNNEEIKKKIKEQIEALNAIGLITNAELQEANSFGDQFRSRMQVDAEEAQKWITDMAEVIPQYMKLAQKKADFESKYGMPIIMDALPPDLAKNLVAHTALSTKDMNVVTIRGLKENMGFAEKTLDTLITQFEQYPPELFKGKERESIYLLGSYAELDANGVTKPQGILASESGGKIKINIRAASPDVIAKLPESLHHEFFHALDGKVPEPAEHPAGSDPEDVPEERVNAPYNEQWYKLFPPGKGSYSLNYDKIPGGNISDPYKGFLTKYGVVDADEDRATIAQVLMLDPARVFKQTKEDPVLRKKVEILTGCEINDEGEIMGPLVYEQYGFDGPQYYSAWSGGKMDYKYWDAALDKSGKKPKS